MGEPKWTKEPPTVSGIYWSKTPRYGLAVLRVNVSEDGAVSAGMLNGTMFMVRPGFRRWWPIPLDPPALGSPEREGNDA